jgi:hypothetical protein
MSTLASDPNKPSVYGLLKKRFLKKKILKQA